MPSSFSIRLALSVAAAFLALTLAGGLLLLNEARENETAKLERGVRQAWMLARLGTGGSRLEDLVAAGRRLREHTSVVGGLVTDVDGAEEARFGEIPVVDDASGWRERLYGPPFHRVQIRDSARRVDIAVDASERASTLRRAAASVSGLVLLVASLVAGLLTWLSERLVVRPQRELTDLLRAPTAEGARRVETSWRHARSLTGRLARAAAGLASRHAALCEPSLRRATALVERYPHPIYVFAADGTLEQANAAALRIFDASDLAELAERAPLAQLRLADGTPLTRAVTGKGRVDNAVARTPRGDIPVLLAFDSLRVTEAETEHHTVVSFVDLRWAELSAGGADDARSRRLVAQLESCLALIDVLGGEAKDTDEKEQTMVDLAALAEGWAEKARHRGLIADLQVADLPVVAGHQPDLERLLGSALDVVRIQSGSASPSLRIDGRPVDGGVAISVTERSDAVAARRAEVAIPMAVLARLGAREGAKLLSSAAPGDPNRLDLQLANLPMPAEAARRKAA